MRLEIHTSYMRTLTLALQRQLHHSMCNEHCYVAEGPVPSAVRIQLSYTFAAPLQYMVSIVSCHTVW